MINCKTHYYIFHLLNSLFVVWQNSIGHWNDMSYEMEHRRMRNCDRKHVNNIVRGHTILSDSHWETKFIFNHFCKPIEGNFIHFLNGQRYFFRNCLWKIWPMTICLLVEIDAKREYQDMYKTLLWKFDHCVVSSLVMPR